MSARPNLRVVRDLDPNGEITNCPHCTAAYAEAEQWREDVLTLKRQLKSALEDKDAKMRNDKHFGPAVDLFEMWKRECRHPKARFDNARIRLAIAAVKLYSPDDLDKLEWVIQYGANLAYVDERGTKHDSFGLLFRDAEHIERYANAWARYRARGGAS